jgi:acetyl esterase/lipase
MGADDMPSLLGESFSWPLWPEASGSEREGAEATGFVFEDATAPVHEQVVSDVTRPRCFAYVPEVPNGRAALVLAGGGYTKLVVGKEGVEVARWLNALGLHAFVLVHRFPSSRFSTAGGKGAAAPLDDALEAMRQIRARAAALGVDPRAIGACGLSSGGHLAACLAARYPESWPVPESTHAGVSARPDFLIIGYAPISTNAAGRTVVPNKPPLPPPEKQALYDALQPDLQLQAAPPPAFLVYAANDAVVPVENAYRLQQALQQRGRAGELHVFADAPHGFALRKAQLPVGKWPELCRDWLARAL